MYDCRAHVVLACITCEKVVLLTTEDHFLRFKGPSEPTANLFLPTVCFSCEEDERKKVAHGKNDKEVPTTMWTSLSISWEMIMSWQPYLAMNAYLEAVLSVQKPKIQLVPRDKVKEMAESEFTVQSVSLDVGSGVAAHVRPYLQSGFF